MSPAVRARCLHDGVKRACAAVVVLCTFALTSARVGEGDRTEPGAIAAIHAILSGESAYASVHGFYDTLECLSSPSCIPGVESQERFLQPNLAAAQERQRYRFDFHAGPKAESGSDAPRSPSAMTRFAVVAIPLEHGSQRRAFCGDDRGIIYFTIGGRVPRVDRGRCLDTGSPIR
jgi:hypothetical protein